MKIGAICGRRNDSYLTKLVSETLTAKSIVQSSKPFTSFANLFYASELVFIIAHIYKSPAKI